LSMYLAKAGTYYTPTDVFVCVCVGVYVCVHVCVYVCVHVCVSHRLQVDPSHSCETHTHTHRQ
jgi:cation transporter-like permease